MKASLLAYRPSQADDRVFLLWWQTMPEGWDNLQELRSQVVASFAPTT